MLRLISKFCIGQSEIDAMHQTLTQMKLWIEERDSTVTGFNIGV